MYGVGTDVEVKVIDPGRRILIEWDSTIGRTPVEWVFTPHADGTFVTVVNSGFQGTPDEKVDQALDSTGGFNIVLSAAKVFLEHDVEPGLIADHAPDHRVKGWKG